MGTSKNIIKYAGAYVAYMIGSGFATGQEVIQFYTSFGAMSIFAIFISMFLFAWVGRTVMLRGYRNSQIDENKAYQEFCGKYLGTFFEYFVPILLFCIVVIMISGAGATISEYYGMNHYVGSLLMAVLIYAAYAFGLKGLVNVIGLIGPVIIVFTILVGIVTIGRNGLSMGTATETAAAMAGSQATGNWIMGGILYAAYNLFGSVIFLTALGKEAGSEKEASWGGALGGIALMTATLVMNIAFLSEGSGIAAREIPTLFLADRISPVIGILFSIVLISGIFSTAAPMAWTVCNKVVKEGTGKSKIVAAAIVVVAFFCGQLPFGTLVGIVYPYTGYLGSVLILCVFYASIKGRRRSERISLASKVAELEEDVQLDM